MLKTLPSPNEIKKRFWIDSNTQSFLFNAREKARNIVTKKDNHLALIVGPCSIHDFKAAIAFAKKIQKIQREVVNFTLVMRLFVEKARTAIGWKGLLYDPKLDGSHQMEEGLAKTRSLFLEIAKMGVPTAAEFVDPFLSIYFSDLVSWGFIGARTSASQIHRQFASSQLYPIGFKNAVDGDLDVAIQGALSARFPHTHATIDEEGKLSQISTQGNPYSYIVLRGSTTNSNYDEISIHYALSRMKKQNLKTRLIIDCSHGNSHRIAENQKISFTNVIQQIQRGNDQIMGLMLESFLYSGNQSISQPLEYGVSITDSCLSIKETEELINWANSYLFCSALGSS